MLSEAAKGTEEGPTPEEAVKETGIGIETEKGNGPASGKGPKQSPNVRMKEEEKTALKGPDTGTDTAVSMTTVKAPNEALNAAADTAANAAADEAAETRMAAASM